MFPDETTILPEGLVFAASGGSSHWGGAHFNYTDEEGIEASILCSSYGLAISVESEQGEVLLSPEVLEYLIGLIRYLGVFAKGQ